MRQPAGRRAAIAALATSALLGAVLWVTPGVSPTAAATRDCQPSGGQDFGYTGAAQTFTVPTGVTHLAVTVAGASGGDSRHAVGGRGAVIEATDIPVVAGQTLTVLVGGAGSPGNPVGGGGTGGGGGGGTFVYTTPDAAGLLVAAGGGGGAQAVVDGSPGSPSTSGTAGGSGSGVSGGQGGTDGRGGGAGPAGGGGGGAGISSDGADSTALSGDVAAGGGTTPSGGGDGGAGGTLLGVSGGAGGFGGGGGAGGGGGGYSGGGGASSAGGTTGGGGGGGSFSTTTPSTTGLNDGHAGGDGYATITWPAEPVTVSFESHGGTGSPSENLSCGATATRPSDPTREGQVFDGWFTKAIGGTEYDFATPVDHDLTLHAQWTGVTASPHTVHPGDDLTITGTGFAPRERVRGVLHSTPVDLGVTTADASGRVTVTTQLPARFATGRHQATLVGVASGRQASDTFRVRASEPTAPTSAAPTSAAPTSTAPAPTTSSAPTPATSIVSAPSAAPPSTAPPAPAPSTATVRPSPTSLAPVPSNSPSPARPGGDHRVTAPYADAYNVDRDEPGAPSVLTGSLPRPTDLVAHPMRIAQALASGLVWTLGLVVVITALNRALKSRYDRFAAAVRRVRPPALLARLGRALSQGHWAAILSLLTANAVLMSLVDPNAGLDLTTGRLVLSLILAQVAIGAVPYLLLARWSRRRLEVSAAVATLPVGLLIAGLGVAISRLIAFVPGLLTGSTMRLAQTGATGVQVARTERVHGILTLVLGFACWGLADAIPATGRWGVVLLHDAAVAATISAFVQTLVEMAPFAMFPGGVLYHRLRWSWAVLTTTATAGFLLFVVPQPRYWINVGHGVARWLAIATVAVLAAVGVLVLLHRRDRAVADQPTHSPEPG